MFTQQSLMSRIAAKDVFTPYEAVLLQYLNAKHMAHQIPDISGDINLYIAVEDFNSLYSSQDLKQILAFNTLQDAQEYDAYKWAADLLMRYDKGSMETTYRGIALMNELRYFRDENLVKFLVNKDELTSNQLNDFTAFSQVHHKQVSFHEIIESFIFTLQILTMTVDNVLTLNHFLNGMIETEDILCISNLKKLLLNHEEDTDNNEQLITPFNIAGFDHEKLFDEVISNNHKSFIQFMRSNLSLLSWQISQNFEKDSLEYVKKIIKEVVK